MGEVHFRSFMLKPDLQTPEAFKYCYRLGLLSVGLTEMNIRLNSVLADIVGRTGQKVLRAIIGGEDVAGVSTSPRSRPSARQLS